MTDHRLHVLSDLAGIVRDRDLAQLAEAAAACQKIEAEIARIDDAVRQRLRDRAQMQTLDTAMIVGADERWTRAQEQRRRALMITLATAAAKKEAAKNAALRAVGRSDVLDKLARGQIQTR